VNSLHRQAISRIAPRLADRGCRGGRNHRGRQRHRRSGICHWRSVASRILGWQRRRLRPHFCSLRRSRPRPSQATRRPVGRRIAGVHRFGNSNPRGDHQVRLDQLYGQRELSAGCAVKTRAFSHRRQRRAAIKPCHQISDHQIRHGVAGRHRGGCHMWQQAGIGQVHQRLRHIRLMRRRHRARRPQSAAPGAPNQGRLIDRRSPTDADQHAIGPSASRIEAFTALSVAAPPGTPQQACRPPTSPINRPSCQG
jgi:hypothetical protein